MKPALWESGAQWREREKHTHEGQSCEITFCAQDALTGVHRVLWDLKQVACSSDQGILRRSSDLILWETTQVNLERQVKPKKIFFKKSRWLESHFRKKEQLAQGQSHERTWLFLKCKYFGMTGHIQWVLGVKRDENGQKSQKRFCMKTMGNHWRMFSVMRLLY